jgi:hypothetical protein
MEWKIVYFEYMMRRIGQKIETGDFFLVKSWHDRGGVGI